MKTIKYLDYFKQENPCYLIFEGDEFSIGLSLPNDRYECYCLLILKKVNNKYIDFSVDSWSNCNKKALEDLLENMTTLKKGNWKFDHKEYFEYLKLKEKYG